MIEQGIRIFEKTGKIKEVIIYSGEPINYSLKSIQDIIKGLNDAGVKFRMIDNPQELLKIVK
jgi:hypothetical protein